MPDTHDHSRRASITATHIMHEETQAWACTCATCTATAISDTVSLCRHCIVALYLLVLLLHALFLAVLLFVQVACVPGWVEQLSSSQLVAVGWLEINAPEEDMPDEAAVLRASLALLAAFPCKPTNLTFKGWSVTTETVMGELAVLAGMDVLSELYRFIFRLHSTHAIPPAPYPIASLPGYIQSIASVQEWCIDARYLHSREVRAFLDSAPTDRTNESALTIVVQGKSEEWGARKHAEFLRSGEHPYVTIVGEPL